MVDGDLFDKMAGLANLLRGSERPFGGIQVCDALNSTQVTHICSRLLSRAISSRSVSAEMYFVDNTDPTPASASHQRRPAQVRL